MSVLGIILAAIVGIVGGLLFAWASIAIPAAYDGWKHKRAAYREYT